MPHDPACIFCKIASAQVPCHKLLETDRVLAFLDVAPIARGHTLVMPKDHFPTIDAVPEEVIAACAAVLPRLCRGVIAATGAKAWNVRQNNGKVAGQSVDHVHFHIIPRAEGDALAAPWPAGKLDAADAKQLLEAIRRGL